MKCSQKRGGGWSSFDGFHKTLFFIAQHFTPGSGSVSAVSDRFKCNAITSPIFASLFSCVAINAHFGREKKYQKSYKIIYYFCFCFLSTKVHAKYIHAIDALGAIIAGIKSQNHFMIFHSQNDIFQSIKNFFKTFSQTVGGWGSNSKSLGWMGGCCPLFRNSPKNNRIF